MPIYEYRCENDHDFEVMRGISDDPVTACEVCAAPVRRVFRPIAVHFKGSGFYNTDYGTRKRSREKESAEAGSSEGSSKESKDSKPDSSSKESSSSKTDSVASKKSETKAAAD